MTTDPFAPKPNSTKVATKWALIGTVVGIVLTYTFQLLGLEQSPIRHISWVPFVAFLLLAQLEYKKTLNDTLTFGQGFAVGFRYSLFNGLLTGLFTYIYLTFLNPDFLAKSMELQRAQFEEKGMSDAQIEQAIEMGVKYGPMFGAFTVAIIMTIIGVIAALITAAIVKKEPSPFDGNDYQEPAI